MPRRIKLHNKTIDYAVRKSKRARRLRVAVYCDSAVVVTVPLGFADNKIERFLRLKTAWILDKIAYFTNLGKTIALPRGKRAFNKYHDQALEFVENKVVKINEVYKYSYNKIAIKNHKSRWGSCSKKGNLNINYRVIFLPEKLAEYIIAHELCHLGVFNHSREFWAMVEKSVPDFRQRITELNAFAK